MENIKEFDLSSLVEETAVELLAERKKEVTSLIRRILLKSEQLSKDIKQLKNETKKKEESLEKNQIRINKLKEGNWSILSEDNKPKENENEK